jgi:hypothetical protein
VGILWAFPSGFQTLVKNCPAAFRSISQRLLAKHAISVQFPRNSLFTFLYIKNRRPKKIFVNPSAAPVLTQIYPIASFLASFDLV